MKYLFLLMSLGLPLSWCYGQNWIDTLYSIETIEDISYGTAVDVAGNERELTLDLSYPTNDTVRDCGRPLLVMIHGGAFIAGDKAEASPRRVRENFAQRGYTTASVSYRLGQFPTHQMVNCNISALEGVTWNCLNMADTSEWYRAYLRGVQDVNGAIRYLVNQAEAYQIDPQNIFVVGESAGGFIAMGVGFLDDPAEVLPTISEELTDVLPPNAIYEGSCIQNYGLDTSINSMQLTRPDLGNYTGSLHFPANQAYRIRGVGNFYGAVFNNVFATSTDEPPALYLFHQPNDLIVPYGNSRIFAGYAYCATQFPFNCSYIINRPHVWGSAGIVGMLEEMASNGLAIPEYFFDPTSNNANCAQQLLNPALQGHAVDNYWLRTSNMASFFAEQIEACPVSTQEPAAAAADEIRIFPNPLSPQQILQVEGVFQAGDQLRLFDSQGQIHWQFTLTEPLEHLSAALTGKALSPGGYLLLLTRQDGTIAKKLIIAQ